MTTTNKSVRESFVRLFGETQARRIEAAAEEHKNGVHDNKGSDPFKWAVLIAIGYECVTKDGFREYHKITVPVEKFKRWCRRSGKLGSHDGDSDYLSLFCGVYNEYLPKRKSATESHKGEKV